MDMATKPSNHNLNGWFSLPYPIDCMLIDLSGTTVLKKPLALFSQKPMTGFYRDGYCRVGPEDGGNHAVAGITLSPPPYPFIPPPNPSIQTKHPTPAVVTKEFLDFSAARGNNLRQIPGLDAGCKWCLCTARWKEAMEAAKGKDDPVVPKYVPVLS